MPSEYYERFGRIKDVEREFVAVRLAMNHLMGVANSDPAILSSIEARDLREASERLEGTYIIRLFAEFESSLRSFWAISRSSQPKTRDLIDGVAALTGVSVDEKSDVHSVREYRNSLIHEREQQVLEISLSDARHTLCRFFRRLAARWR